MNWADVGMLTGVLLATNAGLVWAVKWLLSRHREMVTAEIAAVRKATIDQDDRELKIRQDLSTLRECLPRDYVRREDWIMSFSRIEQKIDAIWRYIHERGK